MAPNHRWYASQMNACKEINVACYLFLLLIMPANDAPKEKRIMIPPVRHDSEGLLLHPKTSIYCFIFIAEEILLGLICKMFYLGEKPQQEKCCDFLCRDWWCKRSTYLLCSSSTRPCQGTLMTSAFSLLPLRNSWHFIYSSFQHVCAVLQHIYSTFFLRCEKITFQHLWHFIKQNCFLSLYGLHFFFNISRATGPWTQRMCTVLQFFFFFNSSLIH